MSEFGKWRLPKVFFPLLVLLSAAVVLTGCQWFPHKLDWNGQAGGPKDVVTVFFSKYQGDHSIVEPVKRPVPKEAQADPAPYAVQELLKGPTPEEHNQGFYSEIPKGTKLLGVQSHDQSINVNLSKQFEAGGGSNSMTQRLEELKQTVYSVDNQHQLTVSVEGKPLEILGGEGLEVPGTLKRENQ